VGSCPQRVSALRGLSVDGSPPAALHSYNGRMLYVVSIDLWGVDLDLIPSC
jgi:hypothetical protein